jgi:hypothetical protein
MEIFERNALNDYIDKGIYPTINVDDIKSKVINKINGHNKIYNRINDDVTDEEILSYIKRDFQKYRQKLLDTVKILNILEDDVIKKISIDVIDLFIDRDLHGIIKYMNTNCENQSSFGFESWTEDNLHRKYCYKYYEEKLCDNCEYILEKINKYNMY